MFIKKDDLSSPDIISLLQEHLDDMYATSPPESVHALDIDALKKSDISFFSAWHGQDLLGCAAIKQHNSSLAELKSMRTSKIARGKGVASNLLQHIVETAITAGYEKIALETGTQQYFEAARNLYHKFGFRQCEPFAQYEEDPNSVFMSLLLIDPRESS